MIISTPPCSIIKPLHEDYKQDLFRLANDKETALLSSHWEPVGWDTRCTWFDERVNNHDFLVMVIAPEGKFLGHIDLKRIDHQHNHAELAIVMTKEERGKGIGTQALKEMVEIGFETLGLKKIYLYTRTDNLSAIKAFSKAGFQKEATPCQKRLIAGSFYDFDIMSRFRYNAA